MHILHISTALEKKFGGPPQAVIGITSALASIGEGMEVFVFGQSQESVHENSEFFYKLESQSVRFQIAKSKRTTIYGGIGTFRDLRELIKSIRKADVVSLHAIYNFQNIIVPFFCLAQRKPFVVMPHGSLTSYQTQVHKIRKILPNLYFVNTMLGLANTIFVATQVELEELPKKFHEKTRVVGLGVDPIRKLVSDERIDDSFNFTFMGRIAPKKQLDLTIKSFALFQNRYKRNTKLIICGDGDEPYLKEIRQLAHELGVFQSLDFRGWVDNKEKRMIWSITDCFVLTSSDENFAIAVAEALSNGIPCLLSKKVALSAIVKSHNAGIVFEEFSPDLIADEMMGIASSRHQSYRDAAIEASKKLEWQTVAEKWHSEFLRIVAFYP